jgi:hypothetical protein
MHPIFTLMLSNRRSNQPRFAQCLGGGILRSYWLICFTNEFDWFIITRALENQEGYIHYKKDWNLMLFTNIE